MKNSCLAIVAFLATSSAACAGQSFNGSESAPNMTKHVVRNANDCAPDRPEPVWGVNSALDGYSCVTPSANGS